MKLACLFMENLSSLVFYLQIRLGLSRVQALPTKIKLRCKGLPWTITLTYSGITLINKKLDLLSCLSLANLSILVKHLLVRLEDFLSIAPLKALALPTNISLGCEGSPGTNSPSYFVKRRWRRRTVLWDWHQVKSGLTSPMSRWSLLSGFLRKN
jgi:hypothetical protein